MSSFRPALTGRTAETKCFWCLRELDVVTGNSADSHMCNPRRYRQTEESAEDLSLRSLGRQSPLLTFGMYPRNFAWLTRSLFHESPMKYKFLLETIMLPKPPATNILAKQLCANVSWDPTLALNWKASLRV
jgi:hypothetical protein